MLRQDVYEKLGTGVHLDLLVLRGSGIYGEISKAVGIIRLNLRELRKRSVSSTERAFLFFFFF